MPPVARKTASAKKAAPTPSGNGAAPDAEQPWGSVTLDGVEVVFSSPTPEQLLVIRRLSRQIDRDGLTPAQMMNVLGKVLDGISAMIEDEAQRDHVDTMMLERRLDSEALTNLVRTAIAGNSPEAAAPATGPVPRARRAR